MVPLQEGLNISKEAESSSRGFLGETLKKCPDS